MGQKTSTRDCFSVCASAIRHLRPSPTRKRASRSRGAAVAERPIRQKGGATLCGAVAGIGSTESRPTTEPLERNRQVRATFVPGERMELVYDDKFAFGQMRRVTFLGRHTARLSGVVMRMCAARSRNFARSLAGVSTCAQMAVAGTMRPRARQRLRFPRLASSSSRNHCGTLAPPDHPSIIRALPQHAGA